MSTRTIVTSQPDVACDVCERRLLRGEQPEIFLAAGQPRTVCELCAPRAAHQGWQRAADGQSASTAPMRSGRGRNLFGRLRQVARTAGASPRGAADAPTYDRESEPYDFLGGAGSVVADRSEIGQAPELVEERSGRAHSQGGAPWPSQPAGPAPAAGHADADAAPQAVHPDDPLGYALEVFNAGEYPRRVAGLTRSLGVPEVSVSLVEDIERVVAIVVAWELCWYRYGVDLYDEAAGVQLLAHGTELEELAREDRLANAAVDERGALSLGHASA
jgi:hypothetical protein